MKCCNNAKPALLYVPGEGHVQPGYSCDECQQAFPVKGAYGVLPE